MKTLDKVIEALDYCTGLEYSGCELCPAFAKPDCNVQQNALEYLKAYRDDKNDLTALRAYWKEQHENSPLTWDEFQKMEGKPVWIEGPLLTEGPHWIILGAVHLYEGKRVGYGKTWQAYRKERN